MQIKVKDFNLSATLESGQVFSFRKISSQYYEVFIQEMDFKIRQSKDKLFIDKEKNSKHFQILNNYFNLEKQLDDFYDLLKSDSRLKPLLKLKGLKIIHQDPFETIISFIISANNNIKRIQHICFALAEKIGKNKNHFPNVHEVADSSLRFLRSLGLGYRAEYVLKTSKMLEEKTELFREIYESDYETSKNMLMEFPGIGEKVAGCILLVGFQKTEAFPVDVWIQRIMQEMYFDGNRVPAKQIRDFAGKNWGSWAGYVQQYLFFGARSGII